MNYDFETFYLGYENNLNKFDKIVGNIASELSLNHNSIVMSQPQIKDSVTEMVNIFNEPFADYSALPSNQMYKEISKFTKVALSGDGADEVFFGYEDAKKFLILFHLRNIFTVNDNIDLGYINRHLNGGILSKFYAYFVAFFFLNAGSFSTVLYNGGWNNFYRKNYMSKNGYITTGKDNIEISEMERFNSSGEHIMEKYVNYYLVRLTYDFMVKVDRTSMANSLEVRSPFLDRSMIKDFNGIGFKRNLSIFKTKKILKEILGNHGFGNITKIRKQGFTPPLRKWMHSKEGLSTINLI